MRLCLVNVVQPGLTQLFGALSTFGMLYQHKIIYYGQGLSILNRT